MKATRSLWAAALAAAGLAVGTVALAAPHGGHGGGGSMGHGHGAAMHGGGMHSSGGWHGSSGGWHGSSGGWHGGGWHGGGWHGGHWHGGVTYAYWWGWPLAFGPWYWWGYPYDYYYGAYYPYGGYGYPYPAYPAYQGAPAQQYPDGAMSGPETTQVQPMGPGAPTQAPAYMNYCESAKAYFPKVTSCPEGWHFVPQR